MKKSLLCLLLSLGFAGGAAGIDLQYSSAGPAMNRAAAELREYVQKMGASADPAKFFLQTDSSLDTEAWRVESVPGGVRLSGGSPRGVLYAVYHYLEDVCGVRWWSPREESVPEWKVLPVKDLRLSGKPAFFYRGIYSLYARDKGRFAARLRMNDDHNSLDRLAPEYGGTLLFGPPNFVHTFGMYVPDSAFASHPEWFSLIDGRRYKGKGTGSDSSQRCLTNPALRAEFKRKLREFIRKGEENAKKNGIPAPKIYEISQNDGSRFCQCSGCDAVVQREEALSGVILDFINDIAGDIAKDYPEIRIRTLAYNKTEAPPKFLRPAPNVIIHLCNMRGNSLVPADPQENPSFYHLLDAWSKRTSLLMTWDYNINYREYNELAYPSEYAYAENLKLYRKMNVIGSFAEYESPIHSDVREYKIYLWLKLQENPDLDFDRLSRQFADGYYGKGGELFLKYRRLLKLSAEKYRPFIVFTPTPDNYRHLDLDTMSAAQKIFDEGEKLLADDPVRLRRWQDAKLSLNRSALFRSKILKREYLRRHGSLEGYPFPNERLFLELREVWNRRLSLRPRSQSEAAARKELEDALVRYGRDFTPGSLGAPKRFQHTSPERLFDFTMENSSRFRNFAELIDDPTSEAGFAARLKFPNASPDIKAPQHRLPLPIGLYAPSLGGTIFKGMIRPEQVRAPGYNWYKLGSTRIAPDAYVFCFPSWLIQQTVGADAYDEKTPKRLFEVWVSVKFTGPEYPHGKSGEPDAIWIDRMVLIRHEK